MAQLAETLKSLREGGVLKILGREPLLQVGESNYLPILALLGAGVVAAGWALRRPVHPTLSLDEAAYQAAQSIESYYAE